jgi:hypothetical protein
MTISQLPLPKEHSSQATNNWSPGPRAISGRLDAPGASDMFWAGCHEAVCTLARPRWIAESANTVQTTKNTTAKPWNGLFISFLPRLSLHSSSVAGRLSVDAKSNS